MEYFWSTKKSQSRVLSGYSCSKWRIYRPSVVPSMVPQRHDVIEDENLQYDNRASINARSHIAD